MCYSFWIFFSRTRTTHNLRYVVSKLGQDLVLAFLSPRLCRIKEKGNSPLWRKLLSFQRQKKKRGLSKMLDEIKYFNHVVYMNTLIKVMGTVHDDFCSLGKYMSTHIHVTLTLPLKNIECSWRAFWFATKVRHERNRLPCFCALVWCMCTQSAFGITRQWYTCCIWFTSFTIDRKWQVSKIQQTTHRKPMT